MEDVRCNLTAATLGTDSGQLCQEVGLAVGREEPKLLFGVLRDRLRRFETGTSDTGTGDNVLFDRFIFLRKSKCGHDNDRCRQQAPAHGSLVTHDSP